MNRSASMALLVGAIATIGAGCFYPPMAKEPGPAKTETVVKLPYDLTWDTVNAVIRSEGMTVQVQNPNAGLIEAQGKSFSLQDADCGRITGIVGSYAALPDQTGTSVFNFEVKALDNERSSVAIHATFDAPLKVPLHPPQDVQCVSRGAEESRLLREIL